MWICDVRVFGFSGPYRLSPHTKEGLDLRAEDPALEFASEPILVALGKHVETPRVPLVIARDDLIDLLIVRQ